MGDLIERLTNTHSTEVRLAACDEAADALEQKDTEYLLLSYDYKELLRDLEQKDVDIEELDGLNYEQAGMIAERDSEIARLREALERISTEDCWPTVYKQIAREALREKTDD